MTTLNNASDRQAFIRRQLKESGSVTVRELAERFDVTRMTIHRDLDMLVEAGIAQKRRGGAVLIRPNAARAVPGSCAMCSTPVNDRTVMVIQTRSRGQLTTCCPHCGLMMAQMLDNVDLILGRDFLHGRMINALDAYFLIGADIGLCCAPSTLCFHTKQDAERFRLGFSGDVLTYDEAVKRLRHQHGSAPPR